MSAIEINGKTYQVEDNGADKEGRKRYKLTGKRGASYGTMRNAKNPEIMFLIDLRGFGIPAGFQGTYLTDTLSGTFVRKITDEPGTVKAAEEAVAKFLSREVSTCTR